MKIGTIVQIIEATDIKTKQVYPYLVGEIVDKERRGQFKEWYYLVLFRSIDQCAWFIGEYIGPVSDAARILYGQQNE